jgi:hypothetical protein
MSKNPTVFSRDERQNNQLGGPHSRLQNQVDRVQTRVPTHHAPHGTVGYAHCASQNGEILAWSGSDFFLTKTAAAIITRANTVVKSDENTSTPTCALCTFYKFLV